MEYRIFFKDKMNTLKGPYTERQVQDWYRKGLFDNDFPFYFTLTDEPPADIMESGILLGSLRSRNGDVCPFINFDEEDTTEFNKENNMKEFEKEIRDVRQKFLAVLSLKDQFTQTDEPPVDIMKSGIVLVSLRSRNGNACPFINFDEKLTREFKEKKIEERLEEIEKDIRDLRQKCTAVISLEQPVHYEMKREALTSKEDEKTSAETTIVKKVMEPAPTAKKLNFHELSESVASLALDAFQVYASGDFASWDKKRAKQIESVFRTPTKKSIRRAMNVTCELVLVEKIKDKEFFCCDLCQHVVFNYKQALVHFFSPEHIANEKDEVKESGVVDIRRILKAFTKLPARLTQEGTRTEPERREKHGVIDPRKTTSLHPAISFGCHMWIRYNQLLGEHVPTIDPTTGRRRMTLTETAILDGTQTSVNRTKSVTGRRAFDELHKHLGQAQTYCRQCEFKTGDREGYYKHLVSSDHMLVIAKESYRYDILTLLVNVHRKDLI